MTAYQLIKKYGWVQGQSGDEESGFCVTGALNYVTQSHREYTTKLRAVRRVIGLQGKCAYRVIDWNDDKKRTKAQVLAVLKRTGV